LSVRAVCSWVLVMPVLQQRAGLLQTATRPAQNKKAKTLPKLTAPWSNYSCCSIDPVLCTCTGSACHRGSAVTVLLGLTASVSESHSPHLALSATQCAVDGVVDLLQIARTPETHGRQTVQASWTRRTCVDASTGVCGCQFRMSISHEKHPVRYTQSETLCMLGLIMTHQCDSWCCAPLFPSLPSCVATSSSKLSCGAFLGQPNSLLLSPA
jgi:hypothetical protein